MKVAVCSRGNTMDSPVDERFGRCAYFVIVDTETGAVDVVRNTGVDSLHGAGVGAVQILLSHGVDVILAGKVGPNAFEALERAGIGVYSVDREMVGEAVERFRAGLLKKLERPSVAFSSKVTS